MTTNKQTDETLADIVAQSPDLQKAEAREDLIQSVTEQIRNTLKSSDVTFSQLAARLKKSKGYVSQLLCGERNMTLGTLSEIYFALGITPVLSIKGEEDAEQETEDMEEQIATLERQAARMQKEAARMEQQAELIGRKADQLEQQIEKQLKSRLFAMESSWQKLENLGSADLFGGGHRGYKLRITILPMDKPDTGLHDLVRFPIDTEYNWTAQ